MGYITRRVIQKDTPHHHRLFRPGDGLRDAERKGGTISFLMFVMSVLAFA